FSKLFPDRFQYPDHIADLSVGVFQPHVDDTAVVRNSVKGRMYFYPASSKNFPDIPGKDHIGAPVFWYFMNDFIVFEFLIHIQTSSASCYLNFGFQDEWQSQWVRLACGGPFETT